MLSRNLDRILQKSQKSPLHPTIGATKVSLPLTASKIHNVLNRAHDTVLDDLGDFIVFRQNYSSSDIKTGDLVQPPSSSQPKRYFDPTDPVFEPDYATPVEITNGQRWSGQHHSR